MHARRVRQPGDHARAVRRPTGSAGLDRRRRAPTRSGNSPAAYAPGDLRRTLAAAASALLPGLGQLINGRFRLARWLAVPILVLIAIVALVLGTNSPGRLIASIVSPTAMSLLLALNLVILGWRLVAVGHAFFDGRYAGRSGRVGAAGLVIVLIAVALPHTIANAWGSAAQTAFAHVFTAQAQAGPGSQVAATEPGPGSDQRLNILIVGIDKLPGRTANLTDTMMVASIDPVGETASIVSIPRDLVRVPLANGNLFGPKLNSLMAYGDNHPEMFPEGGMRALEEAIGALLGIPIHYYAKMDFFGFVKVIDAAGGIDVTVAKDFYDPKYDGLGVNPPKVYGWGLTAGRHHLNGYEALAYSRSRYAPGGSDFVRAGHQQEVLVALRDKLTSDGSLFWKLPDLLEALGDLVTTDLPTDRLPELAAIIDEMGSGGIYRAVLQRPLIKTGGIDAVYGSVQVPDVPAIQEVARGLFPPPGETPISWPAATPASTVPASAAPASTAP